jgi:hypothetical protein
MIALGSKARDPISGFEGIVTARTEYLYSVPQVALTPERVGVNGERLQPEWFEEARLEGVDL